MDFSYISMISVYLLLAHCTWQINAEPALILNSENYQDALNKNKVLLVNFYADWCHFSRQLTPIWDTAAGIVAEEFSNARLGKVDCEQQQQIAMDNLISKYPTIKVFRNGKVQRYEYRGQRSVDAFTQFVRQQMKPSLKEWTNAEDFKLDPKRPSIVAYLESRGTEAFRVFEAVADDLRESCDFWIGVGDASAKERVVGEHIVFKPQTTTGEVEQTYTGPLTDLEAFKEWAQDKCVPLIREITFENGEALTEEGLPFLILFHKPGDGASVAKFKNAVIRELMHEKGRVNFLTADGTKFSHPLHHLGKTIDDLPLICIDSFRHMYLFKNFREVEVPGKMKQFVMDLHSGKLHMDFHNPPPESQGEDQGHHHGQIDQQPQGQGEQKQPDTGDHHMGGDQKQPEQVKSQGEDQGPGGATHDQGQMQGEGNQIPHSGKGGSGEGPPETVFSKLAPSENRYTLLHWRDYSGNYRDEL